MRDTCIIVTWLAKDQPGFLDFSYRVRSLAKVHDTILVSPYALTQEEFAIPGVVHCVLESGMGRAGWISYMLAAARLIRRQRPACAVLLHSMLAPLAWLTGATPTALYWNEHPSRFTASPPGHPWFKRQARKLALKWFFIGAARRAGLVMPIGEEHEADLLANGMRREQLRRIYMGVDAAFRFDSVPPRAADAPLELVYIGTVNRQRGRNVMLEAVALANMGGAVARLTIIGADETQAEECRDYAQRLGIGAAVTVRGRIAGGEIPAVLQSADAGLSFMEDLPWWRLNPPTKLFEYLVAGVPVLASDIPTQTRYLGSWENGLICRYDSRHLAERIIELWHRRGELAQLKQRARTSGEQYLWNGIEPDFLQAIRLLARRQEQKTPMSGAGNPARGKP